MPWPCSASPRADTCADSGGTAPPAWRQIRRLRSTYGTGMPSSVAPELRVVHEARGRLRVHLPRWSGVGADRVESKLLGLRGVTVVRASAAAGNVLVCFDVDVTDRETVMERLRGLRGLRVQASRPQAARPGTRSRSIT